MTRVIGLLSFWDESPTWLAATITSMARVCDHIVALDGRYALYPDQRLQSGAAEFHAIIGSARAAGVGITLHTQPRVYADEMEKRTKLFELGLLEAELYKDWFFVCDGDEMLIEAPPKQHTNHMLESIEADVVAIKLWEKTDPHENPARTELGMKLECQYQYECPTPRFWRAHKNMRVVGYHYNYLGEDAAGVTKEFWGQDGVVKNRPEWHINCSQYVLENRNRLRAKVRDRERQAYYQTRDELGVETVKPLTEYQECA